MLAYECSRIVLTRLIRFMIVVILLVPTAIVAKHEVNLILELSHLAPPGARVTVSDYLMGMLNGPQFIMFFLLPTLFSILVADLITMDFTEGYISLIAPRLKNRMNYVLTKTLIVFFAANVFIISAIVVAIMTWIMLGVPLQGEKYHYMFHLNVYGEIQLLNVWVSVYLAVVFGLTFIGLLTLVISTYTKSAAIAVGSIIVLGVIHNGLYVTSNPVLVWMPFTQYIRGLNSQYYPFGIPVDYFTSGFSSIYIFLGSILMFTFLFIKHRKSDLSYESQKG